MRVYAYLMGKEDEEIKLNLNNINDKYHVSSLISEH